MLISACGRQGNPGADIPPPTLVEVNLTVTGGPLTSAGTLAPKTVTLSAVDSNESIVTFDDELKAVASGGRQSIEFAQDQSIVTLYLSEGETYFFTAKAADFEGNFLAYGTTQRTVVSGGSNATLLHLSSHLGAAILTPVLPTIQLLPGQIIEVALQVSPHEREDLRVALGDYGAVYETSNGTNLSYSGKGLRLRAGHRESGDLHVTATASGRIDAAGESILGIRQAELRIPFVTGLTVDLKPPTVSDLAFDQEQQVFTGIASDNFGIARLDIFEGPEHLASTDQRDVERLGLAPVAFPGGGTAFHTRLSMTTGHYQLTAVATDTSGLVFELELGVRVD